MENLDAYDGIVITHGTDTMAYTASVLSYMLQNLTKPVVLTGSQMPIDNLLTDARNNLYTAFSAVDCRIPGVSIAFDHKLIRGCRAVKVRTMGFEAFESVNAPLSGGSFRQRHPPQRERHPPRRPQPPHPAAGSAGAPTSFCSS